MVPSILEHVSPDLWWGFACAADDVPWHRPVEGSAELPRSFADLMQHTEIRKFEVQRFFTTEGAVVVQIRLGVNVKRTGRYYEVDHVHVWSFAEDGRVNRMVHYEDTATVQAAWRG